MQQKNPTCWVDTYQGGLSCCHHENVLLDADQEPPEELLTYHLKFRFYFEPYEPATDAGPASPQNLVRLYWQTEALAGEYDVPKKEASTPPHEAVHEITARWQVYPFASWLAKFSEIFRPCFGYFFDLATLRVTDILPYGSAFESGIP